MRRREFITLLGATAAWPLAAHAQSADRIAHVGVLGPDPNNNPVTAPGYQVFLSELRKLGFTEGHNLVVQYRRTDEGLPKAFTGANEMVAAKADVLVANGPEVALQAAAAARPAVPIVMLASNYDPFVRGYVQSLAKPGGNVTGLFYRQPELAVKRLELMVEAFPERTRVAILWDRRRMTRSAPSSAPCNQCDCRCVCSSSKIHLTISMLRFKRWCRAKHKCCMSCRALCLRSSARTSRNSRSGIACQQCSSLDITSRQAG